MSKTPSRTANRALWTAQALLALLFLFSGVMKLLMSPEQMQGPIALPVAFIRFIGVAEALGALGLVLPGLTRVRTALTPIAASGLTIIMVGATVISFVGMGPGAAILPFFVGVVAAAVAYGRFRVAPLGDRSAAAVPSLA